MNISKRIPDPAKPINVLVAPLDWGLGHAIRCIPIIHELIEEGFSVFIATGETQEILLRKEFPKLPFLPIPSYNIFYSRRPNGLAAKLFFQLPKIFQSIRKEHQWLKSISKLYRIDIVISDNRPGLNNADVYGIYITHQLNFTSRFRFLNHLASRLHRRFIDKFNECWIPDIPNGLSGKLSLVSPLPENYHFIGPISRLQNKKSNIRYDVAIILSGPEPQRTIFENLLLKQISVPDKRIIFIRGIPDEKRAFQNRKNLSFFNYMSANELNVVIAQSSFVISRSGYTSIMDFARLNTKAILIPTPGQPEQEYLAKYLSGKGCFLAFPQKNFSLKTAIRTAEKFRFQPMDYDFDSYKKFIRQLRQKKESPLHTR